jgi:creatinine amidohydrolase/Fe(II)-dependent formamide hydrolase-like protein
MEIRFAVRTNAETRTQRELWTRHGVTLGQAGFHAGRTESSSMLEYRPDLVHMDQAAPGLDADDFYEPDGLAAAQTNLYVRGVAAFSSNGVMGNPLGATAELGREVIDLNSEYVLRELIAPFDD